MHQIIFIGAEDRVDELEVDESPVDAFPCMSSQQFHRDARAQLYALVMEMFLDEAIGLEELYRPIGDDGPYIYRLDAELQSRLARLEDDDIGELAEHWIACEELEVLNLEENDLTGFLYQFVHFCHTAMSGDDLAVYIYSDS